MFHFIPHHTHVQASTEHQAETVPARQTFHRFGELPFELRSTIWHMAMRPAGIRGVHRFSIIPGLRNRVNASLGHSALAVRHEDDQEAKNIDFQVSAPPNNNSPPDDAHPAYSWGLGNHSTYLWDAGLWTACAESRRLMMKRREAVLKRAEAEELQQITDSGWSGRTKNVRKGHVVEKFNFLRSTMTIALASGEQVPLAIYGCDLHVLDVHPHLLSYMAHSDPSPIFLSSPDGDKPTFSFGALFKQINHPQHVAVEFNPRWNVNLENDFPGGIGTVFRMMAERSPRGFIARVAYACAEQAHAIRAGSVISRFSCKLWLIDHERGAAQLRRRHDSPRTRDNAERTLRCREGVEFRDCKDRYVALNIGGPPVRDEWDEPDPDFVGEYHQTAAFFLEHLGRIFELDHEEVKEYLGVLLVSPDE